MSRKRTLAVAFATTVTTAGLIAGSGIAAEATSTPAPRTLAGSAVPFATATRATGAVAAGRQLTIQLWLSPRLAAAQAYALAVSTPGSKLYRHYLAPAQYAARFGAAPASVAKTESWLRSAGFARVGANAGRDYVSATGSVASIDAAFKTELMYYRATSAASAGSHRLYANASALTLPDSLRGTVLGVTGLNNAAPVQPLDRAIRTHRTAGPVYKCSSYYGQFQAKNLSYKQNGTSTYPTVLCGYSAKQFRSAYGANTVNTGKGQTVALVELGLTPGMFTTLKKYAAASGIPAPAATRYKELNIGNVSVTKCGDPFYVEESLDVEAAYDMAPGANEYVIGGDACDTGFFGLQGLFDADIAVLDGHGGKPLASIASNSWGSGDESQAPMFTNIEHAYLVKAAAVGVGEYFSSGDGSGVFEPASDPFTVAVGGTTLDIGKAGNRLFETGWSTKWELYDSTHKTWIDAGEQAAAGGGKSMLWAQPAYQKGKVPKALDTPTGNRGGLIRSDPDISADADPFTGINLYVQVLNNKGVVTGYQWEPVGGTSLASPLVAGIVAAAQQGQKLHFGFLDPALYKLRAAAYADTLPLTKSVPVAYNGVACDPFYCNVLAVTQFDDQSPSMGGYTGQVTLKGYDNMSGLGVPNGQAFITALRAIH